MTQKGIIIITLFAGLWGCNQKPVYKDPVLKSANDLIERVIPGYSGQFKLEIIEPESEKDIFEVDQTENQICLRGNNAVAIAFALNWYLKYNCNAHLSWCGDQLDLPEGHPPKETKKYLNAVGNSIYDLMTEFDPDALWAMQAWSIRKDISVLVLL